MIPALLKRPWTSLGREARWASWERWRLALRLRWVRATSWPLRRRLARCGPHLFLGKGVRVRYPQYIGLGDSVVLEEGVLLSCSPGGNLILGDLVHLSRYCVVACGVGELRIGSYTIVGEYTSIRNTDHGIQRGQLIRAQEQHCEPIIIGEDVWIGRGCAVLKGVTIGEGAVIGANSVVTTHIPPYAIAVGAPARVLKYRE